VRRSLRFPAVSIEGSYYCDGSLRQNTPLSPACAWSNLLVVALRHDAPSDDRRCRSCGAVLSQCVVPLRQAAGCAVLDPIQYDLAVLNRINRILQHGREVYGAAFEHELSRVVEPLRGKPYRIIDDILVQPSQDIGRIAAQEASRLDAGHWGPGPAARMFRRVADVDTQVEADLLSYLLFDGVYAQRLMQLGFNDAQRKEEKLVAFFRDEPIPENY
jgi:NTE family protein